jgi:hypothetical protein
LIDALDTDLRLRVTAPGSDSQIFVGIGPTAAVDAYLDGVAHDEITGLVNGGTPVYRTSAGSSPAAEPADQTFWAVATSGLGTQQLRWSPTNGRWAVVIMNADGSANVTAAATVEIRAGFLLPLALTLLVIGVLFTLVAVALIVMGALGQPIDKKDQRWLSDSSTIAGSAAATVDHRPR